MSHDGPDLRNRKTGPRNQSEKGTRQNAVEANLLSCCSSTPYPELACIAPRIPCVSLSTQHESPKRGSGDPHALLSNASGVSVSRPRFWLSSIQASQFYQHFQ